MAYPKFKTGDTCAFPERIDCNYGETFLSRETDQVTGNTIKKVLEYPRCKHMYFITTGNWGCNFKKVK